MRSERIYAHAGQMDKARDAFEYVAEHGNKLHAVDVAKAQLEEMDEVAG